MKIGRKLAIGYTVIVALIGGIVYTYLREWRQMVSLESEIKQIHEVRQSVHEAYVHMLDLTMFGETILEWEKADTAIYRAKRHKVDSILCEFKDYYSGERIDSLRALMAEKEIQLFNISQLFEKQLELGEELAERVPVIAYESTQQEPEKKKRGFLGLFKKKEKPQPTTTTKLYTLNRDVVKKQSEQNRRLTETADSLAQRNYIINTQLKSLIAAMDERVTTDLREREQQIIITREETKVWLGGITAFLLLSLVISYIIIMNDHAKKERGRRKLEESNRKNAELLEMRKKIILTISHDIRSPLNSIIGYSELAMDTRDKKKRNQQLKKVLGRSKHILHLVNNLLDVYRLNQAKETMHPVPFRISDLLNRVVDGATQPINDKGLLFEHEFTGTNVVVKGDVDRIEQVINNLIANAVKFTSSGHIAFNVNYSEGVLVMKVSDTGVGMSEELMKRIYMPFERAANADNADGYGLGLPIAKGIVTMIGGTIDVKSTLGEGTTFTVTLPLPITDEAVEDEKAPIDSTLHLPKNVIVIDDDTDINGTRYHPHIRLCTDQGKDSGNRRRLHVLQDLGQSRRPAIQYVTVTGREDRVRKRKHKGFRSCIPIHGLRKIRGASDGLQMGALLQPVRTSFAGSDSRLYRIFAVWKRLHEGEGQVSVGHVTYMRRNKRSDHDHSHASCIGQKR